MKNVLEFLNKLKINKNQKIVVAVSYGPDSMALLNLLKRKYSSSNVICAHVHHNHRKESDKEAEDLKKYCKENNIIFEMMKIKNYKNSKFTEEEARKRRYTFFEEILYKYNSKYLFTAHHGDDLVETILMRITRGSSLKGYSGIPLISVRKGYNIIRPFLYITKKDILNYCNVNNISYALDKSNYSDIHTRNRYRKYILAKLKEENKNIHMRFLKFSEELEEYEEYVNNKTNSIYDSIVKNNIIYLSNLLKQDDLIIKRIIMRYLFEYYGDDINKISNANIFEIMKIVKDSKPNLKVMLPNKISLIKSYNKLYFNKEKEYNDYCFLFDDYVLLPNKYFIKKISNLENTTNNIIAINTKEVTLPLYIRNKLDGDSIEVLNLNGRKKVKDIFINEKIDKEKRNGYPILVDSKGEIIWIPGIKKSKYDKSKQGKYDIILKYQKKEEKNETK